MSLRFSGSRIAVPDVRHENLVRELGAIATGVIGGKSVKSDQHFFEDLGADSLVMARFCARVRRRPDLPSPSMKLVYQHPTLDLLAAALVVPDLAPAAQEQLPAPTPPRVAHAPVSTTSYVVCGVLQFLAFLVYVSGVGIAADRGYSWITAGDGVLEVYLRALAAGALGFTVAALLPIAAKWILIGRWTEREFPIWSLTYVRFWVVRSLIRANPLLLVAIGSPILPWYLRALGADVGRGVTILSRSVPVITDLLTIGDGAVIRKDSALNGYAVEAGWLRTGRVTIGANAFVGESTVVDLGTRIGDGAQLGHSSSLHTGQAVPDGESWHGTPGRRTAVDHRRVPELSDGTARRARYVTGQLLWLLLAYLPLGMAGVDLLVNHVAGLSGGLEAGVASRLNLSLLEAAVPLSAVLFLGAVGGGLVLVTVLPRLLTRLIRPEKVYPLFGFHYSVHRLIARLTNLRFFMWFFGDSSYIVHYLRGIGYDLSHVAQTGSNFGTAVKHETPFLVTVGSGTMVADGLSVMNAEFSATSFRVTRANIGASSFLGNRIAYPSGGRTGENVLLATKALVPLDGPVRENTGLLGSPPFEIPRTVSRDADFDHLAAGPEFAARLRRKNRYNLRSMGLGLLVRWLHTLGVTVLMLLLAQQYDRLHGLAFTAEVVLALLFTIVYFVVVERAAAGFRRLRPQLCSIYDPYFWWHERFWKLVAPDWDRIFAGTPFKNWISWSLGVKIGRRVFDDGLAMPERTLVTIGDDACLNAGSVVQCHSQEDGAFKSDRSRLGDRVTLAPGAFVHYGTSVGDDAVIGPDSFLMKGEEVPAGAYWCGNPALETRSGATQESTR